MATNSFVDARRSRRVPEAKRIRLAIGFENYRMPHEVLTMNESLHGVRVRIAVPLIPGEKIVVFPKADSQRSIPARVVWTRAGELSFEGAAGLEILDSLPK